MKYDIYCTGMWLLLKNNFKRELSNHIEKKDAKIALNKAKIEFRNIVQRTEGIGGVKQNPLAVNLINCMMLVAIYKSVSNKLSQDDVGDIYIEAMRKSFVVKRSFNKKNMFCEEWQNNRKAISENANANGYKNDWIGELVKGKGINEFGINYTECGICKICKQEGCADLAKQMCKFDYVSVDMMGAKLIRTKTIANGDGICDFWFVKKD